ncbi:MAG: hypothetical protein K1060chlam5_01255 [Candidatus Anoxychlamydiales bacterium]|nr:hypothetical protein [Candidatus Anoxychlamydiales bacterium]
MIFFAYRIKENVKAYFPYTVIHFKEDKNGLVKKIAKAVFNLLKDFYYILFNLEHIHEKTRERRLEELKDTLKIDALQHFVKKITTTTKEAQNDIEKFFVDGFLDFKERLDKILEALSLKEEEKPDIERQIDDYLKAELSKYRYDRSKGFVKSRN